MTGAISCGSITLLSINRDMKLYEVLEIELLPLDEAYAWELDFGGLVKSYGSWIHPRFGIKYVNDKHGHSSMAEELLRNERIMPGESLYKKMFDKGWVRAVHNGLTNFWMSAPAENLKKVLPFMRELHQFASRVTTEVEECDPKLGRCKRVEGKGGTHNMAQSTAWNELLRAI